MLRAAFILKTHSSRSFFETIHFVQFKTNLLLLSLIFLNACASSVSKPAPYIPSEPKPKAAEIKVAPNLLEFGDIDIGSGPKYLDVSVTNIGEADLRIRETTVGGRAFRLYKDRCAGRTISPNNSCVITVSFDPGSKGYFAGVLNISDGNMVTVNLNGTSVEQPPPPSIEVSPSFLEFGDVKVSKKETFDITVKNTGGKNLKIGKVTLSGAGFEKTDNCMGKSITPHSSCSIKVSFSPVSSGNFSGILNIISDDPNENIFTVNLSGKGLPQLTDIEVTPSTPRPTSKSSSLSTLPPTPPCPYENLETFSHNDKIGTMKTKSGSMRRGTCQSYSMKIEKTGDVIICISPGYSLTGDGIEYATGEECKFQSDPIHYKRYRRLNVEGGISIDDVKITRGENSPDKFKFIFRLYPR